MTEPPRTLQERLRWSGLDAMTKHLSLGMFKLHAEAADALDAQSKLLAEARELIEPIANGMPPNAIALSRFLAKLKAATPPAEGDDG